MAASPKRMSVESISSIDYMGDVVKFAENLVNNLDEEALIELFGGSEKDINEVFTDLIQEIDNVLNFNQRARSSSYQTLDTFSKQVEDQLRCDNFAYFVSSVLHNFVINWHHLEIMNMVQLYQKICVIASRGSGKSYLASYAYPLWKLYKYKQSTALIQQPYDIALCEFGMLFTHEMSLAEELLLSIKQGIESNEILYEKLYNDKGDNWSKRSITCRNGARLQTKSYTSSARGRHPGYVVVDDYLVDNVISSTDFNANINNKFYSVIDNLPLKGGSVFVVGTPFSTVDLYSTFKKPESKYKVFEYPAIFPDGSLLWPEFYPMDVIEEKKKTQGNIVFSREILCKPITSDSTIFPYHILEKNFSPLYTLINNIYSAPVRFQKVVMGCDFAISANIGADFSVFCTLGVDDKNRFWLLNLWRAQGKSYQEQIAQIKYLYQNFKHDVIFLEDNAMQKIFVEGTKASMLGMPIKGHTTTKIKNDLQKGWPSLAILFENERFVLPRGDQSSIDQIDLVCAELNSVTFAGGKLASATQHDDIVSAIWIAVQGALYKDDSLRLHF